MQVHVAGVLEFLVMVCVCVELGPHGNHEAAVQGMDVVQHLLRSRVAGGVKGVTPPLVVFPVLPVLDNIVHRNVPLTQLPQRFYQVLLRSVALAALPEAQHPFGHYGRLAGELAVVLDDIVIIFSGHEVAVQLGLAFAPEGELIGLDSAKRLHPEADIGHIPVRLPRHLDGRGYAGFQVDGVFVAVGVPGRTPAAAHHFLSADAGALEARIVLDEVIVARFLGGQRAFIGHFCALERYLGQVLDGKLVLIEEAVFLLHQHASLGGVSALQLQVKYLAQLPVGLVGTPSAQGIGVEEEAVALVGHHHGHAHFGVVLVQLFLAAFVVELPCLVLAQAVEGLVLRAVEAERGAPAVSVGDQRGMAAQCERGAIGLVKVDFTIGLVNVHGEFFRGEVDLAHGVGDCKLRFALLGQHHQALTVVELAVCTGAHADNFRRHHLQAEGVVGTFNLHLVLLAGRQRQKGGGQQNSLECNFHRFRF